MKPKVILLFGGPGEEHDISLASATAVLKNTDTAKWTVYPVGITKEGTPYYYNGDFDSIASGEWKIKKDCLFSLTFGQGLVSIRGQRPFLPEAVFPLMHGDYGEDGRLQGLLECLGLPYVGCDCLCSGICMHKHHAKLQFENSGIPTAKWMLCRRDDLGDTHKLFADVADTFGQTDLFVKPAMGGSSVGASAVKDKTHLIPALERAFRYHKEALIEERISGMECEVGVLADGEITVSQPASVETTHSFYDYKAKYTENTTKLTVPALLPHEVAEQMRFYAKKAFLDLGCRHLARFDFFYDRNGRVLLSEVNTLPGMTERSLYPRMMQHSGISFPDLITRLLTVAMG